MSVNLPKNISGPALKAHLNTAALRQQLLAQVEKDLELEPLAIDAHAADFFNALHECLVILLRHKIERQPHTIAQLIYRVDVHEATVKNLLANQQADAAQALAEAIILREMKKVFYRNVYAGKIVI